MNHKQINIITISTTTTTTIIIIKICVTPTPNVISRPSLCGASLRLSVVHLCAGRLVN